MTKPSPTDATTKLDAARTAVRDHIKDLIDWRSSMTLRGNETAAATAWNHISELREVSDQLDVLVSLWTALTGERPEPTNATSVQVPEVVPESLQPSIRAPLIKDPISSIPDIELDRENRVPNKPTTRLRVKLPDSSIIQEATAAETLVEFIRWVGVERVRDLGIIVDRNPFISTNSTPNHSESSKKLLGGYFVETHSDTNKKRRLINRIATGLNLRISVSLVQD